MLNGSRALLDDKPIRFKCLNALLDAILYGAACEHCLELQPALPQHDDVIHKNLFLDLVLRENRLLLHEFEAAVRLLFRGNNNRSVL